MEGYGTIREHSGTFSQKKHKKTPENTLLQILSGVSYFIFKQSTIHRLRYCPKRYSHLKRIIHL